MKWIWGHRMSKVFGKVPIYPLPQQKRNSNVTFYRSKARGAGFETKLLVWVGSLYARLNG